MRKLTALIVASTLALGSSTLAFAADETPATAVAPQTNGNQQMMQHHKGKGMDSHRGSMFSGLNLTTQQREQMRDIMQQQRNSVPRMEQADRQAMHQVLTAENFDEAKAKELIDASTKAHAERALQRIKAQNKMYNLLTPEQKTQFNAQHQQRMEKMNQRHEMKNAS